MSEAHAAPANAPVDSPPPQRRSLPRLILVEIPSILCGALLLAAVAINIVNVVGRYVFAAPVSWAEEVLVYIIVWGVFVSAGSITYQGLHLRMDLLVIRAQGAFKMFLGALTAALLLFCSVFMLTQSFRVVQLYFGSGETSMGAKIPLVLPHAAILVGFALVAAATIIRVRAYLTDRFD